jgi:hypothetical protein
MQYLKKKEQSGVGGLCRPCCDGTLLTSLRYYRPEKVGLSQYLASLKNVNESLTQLKQSNLRSSQKAVQQMTGLLKAGSLQLEELFRQTLAEDSQPIEPLHYLTKGLFPFRGWW